MELNDVARSYISEKGKGTIEVRNCIRKEGEESEEKEDDIQ